MKRPAAVSNFPTQKRGKHKMNARPAKLDQKHTPVVRRKTPYVRHGERDNEKLEAMTEWQVIIKEIKKTGFLPHCGGNGKGELQKRECQIYKPLLHEAKFVVRVVNGRYYSTSATHVGRQREIHLAVLSRLALAMTDGGLRHGSLPPTNSVLSAVFHIVSGPGYGT